MTGKEIKCQTLFKPCKSIILEYNNLNIIKKIYFSRFTFDFKIEFHMLDLLISVGYKLLVYFKKILYYQLTLPVFLLNF